MGFESRNRALAVPKDPPGMSARVLRIVFGTPNEHADTSDVMRAGEPSDRNVLRCFRVPIATDAQKTCFVRSLALG